LYSGDSGFLVSAPAGWVTDTETGKKLGGCCVFYPEGSSWDNAITVMYPNIVAKKPGQATLKEFMENDLEGFKSHDPDLTYEDSKDLSVGDGRTGKVRYFYGVNRGSSEAVAYVDEPKVIALLVLSSKTRKGLNDSMRDFQQLLQSYQFVHIRQQDDSKSANPKSQ
jgi:hypothetical protein